MVHVPRVELILFESNIFAASVHITNRENSLLEAVALGDLRRVQTTLKSAVNVNATNSEGDTSLMIAAARGNTELIQLLRTHGAHVDAHNLVGETALFQAVRSGSKAAVAMLLSMTADTSLLNKNYLSALHCAVTLGDLWMVQALAHQSSNVINMKDQAGRTALYCAVENQQARIVEALVDAGADVDEPDDEGVTCLMLAVNDNSYSLTRTLLWAGANRDALDDEGRTALSRCAEDPTMRRILTGANVDVEAEGGWLLDHLTSLCMNDDDALLCMGILVDKHRLTCPELFAALPASSFRRHQLDSIGITALGTQQVLRNLHRSLQPSQICNGASGAGISGVAKAEGRKRPLYDINLTSSDEETESSQSQDASDGSSDGSSVASNSHRSSDSQGSDASNDSGTGASEASDQEGSADTASDSSTSTSTSTSSSHCAHRNHGHADLTCDISPITGAAAGIVPRFLNSAATSAGANAAAHSMPPPPSMFPQRTPAVTTAPMERLLSPPHKRPRLDLVVQSAESSRGGSGGAEVLNESFGDAPADEEVEDSDAKGDGSEAERSGEDDGNDSEGENQSQQSEGEGDGTRRTQDSGTQQSSQVQRAHTKGRYFQEFLRQPEEAPDLAYTADEDNSDGINGDGIDFDSAEGGQDSEGAGQDTLHSSRTSQSSSPVSPMVHTSRRRTQVVHRTPDLSAPPLTSTQYTCVQYESTQYVSDLYDITITDVTGADVDLLADVDGEDSDYAERGFATQSEYDMWLLQQCEGAEELEQDSDYF